MAGVATDKNAAELRAFTLQFRQDVLGWLKERQPELLSSPAAG